MKIREKRRLTQNKGVSVKIRETWQVCFYADNASEALLRAELKNTILLGLV